MIVLASHLPGEGYFESEHYQVVPILCSDDFDYWSGVAKWWHSPGTIINIEHDMEVTDEHLSILESCPHLLCSFVYRCHWISTGRPDDIYAARNGGDFVEHGTEWAQQSAIGLVKITRQARIASLDRAPWNRLEVSIENAVERPWHLHWDPEPQHHHW